MPYAELAKCSALGNHAGSSRGAHVAHVRDVPPHCLPGVITITSANDVRSTPNEETYAYLMRVWEIT